MSKKIPDQAIADRASGFAGKEITFRRGEEVIDSECVSTTQNCPSCRGFHPILPIKRRDENGHAWVSCPTTKADMVETPAGIFLPAKGIIPQKRSEAPYQPTPSPFEIEEEDSLLAIEEARVPVNVDPGIVSNKPVPSVFSAVHAKIKQEHSQQSFQLADGLFKRMVEVQNENQRIDKEIARLQQLRASLTTEHLWLQKTVEEFDAVSEPPVVPEAPADDTAPAEEQSGKPATKGK